MTLAELFDELDDLVDDQNIGLKESEAVFDKVKRANNLSQDILRRLASVSEAHREVLDFIQVEKERLAKQKYNELLLTKQNELITAIMAVEEEE